MLRHLLIEPPLLTCESVLSKACFLLARAGEDSEQVLELVRRGVVRVAFDIGTEIDSIAKLMNRYADVPISMADAALVRLDRQADESLCRRAHLDGRCGTRASGRNPL